MGKKKDAYELLGKITGWYLGDPTVFPKRLRGDIAKWIETYEVIPPKEDHHPYCDCDVCQLQFEVHEENSKIVDTITNAVLKALKGR